jgi:hypothetical protein
MSEHDHNTVEESEARWISEQQSLGPTHPEDSGWADAERVVKGSGEPTPGIAAPVAAASGALAGGTAGTIFFGPIGTIIGAVAGAVTGAVAGASGSEVEDRFDYDANADARYSKHYEALVDRPSDRSFETARPAYLFGHIAARTPAYRGRAFEEIEPELRGRWSDELRERYGEWSAVRPMVRGGFEPSLARAEGETFADLHGGDSSGRASFNDPIPTYIEPANSSTGQDAAGGRMTPSTDHNAAHDEPIEELRRHDQIP